MMDQQGIPSSAEASRGCSVLPDSHVLTTPRMIAIRIPAAWTAQASASRCPNKRGARWQSWTSRHSLFEMSRWFSGATSLSDTPGLVRSPRGDPDARYVGGCSAAEVSGLTPARPTIEIRSCVDLARRLQPAYTSRFVIPRANRHLPSCSRRNSENARCLTSTVSPPSRGTSRFTSKPLMKAY